MEARAWFSTSTKEQEIIYILLSTPGNGTCAKLNEKTCGGASSAWTTSLVWIRVSWDLKSVGSRKEYALAWSGLNVTWTWRGGGFGVMRW